MFISAIHVQLYEHSGAENSPTILYFPAERIMYMLDTDQHYCVSMVSSFNNTHTSMTAISSLRRH